MSDTEDDNPDDKKMPLLAHLVELRQRIIWSMVAFFICFGIAFYFANDIFDFLTRPLATVWEGQEGRHLIYTALQEKFFANVKVAMFGGFALLAFPIIAVADLGLRGAGFVQEGKDGVPAIPDRNPDHVRHGRRVLRLLHLRSQRIPLLRQLRGGGA